MNILHINQSDKIGGAAIAGYRLHKGLISAGISSQMIVGNVIENNQLISSIPRKYRWENKLSILSRNLGLQYLHYIGSFDIKEHQSYQSAEVINLHNLHSHAFSYLAIPALTKNKPAIFTLHDMWAFTGLCLYSYDCNYWQKGCGSCPYLDMYSPFKRDSTRLEWKLKNWIYSNSNLTIVAPSEWMAEQVKNSMLNRFPIHHIPNGVDIDIYKPLERKLCRLALDIPEDKYVLMFSAFDLKDYRKGGDLLIKALQELPTSIREKLMLIAMGNRGDLIADTLKIPTLELGYVSNDRLKAIAYSASDLFVLPSRADNLPLVLQESMACGTPMISFNVGGIPDLVRPGITGYLAHLDDYQDFCSGIIQLFEDKSLYNKMKKNCREIALKEYSLSLQVERYIDLYQQVLS
jgi:glycosyltransferase involved in cell wall biosynthesis